MDTIGWLAARTVRRGWRATVLLAVLAGLAGGVAMAAWTAGRRTASALDRLLAATEPADLIVNFCPPGVDPESEGNLFECFGYDPVSEAATIDRLPEIDRATRALFAGATVSPPGQPERTTGSSVLLGVHPDLPQTEGRMRLDAGRWFAPERSDEVVVNQPFVDHTGFGLGDELELGFWSSEEAGLPPWDGEQFHGPRATVTVVGVGRSFADLPARVGTAADRVDSFRVVGGPALADTVPDAASFSAVLVRGAAGAGDPAEAIEDAFPNRPFNVGPGLGEDELGPVEDAVDYEARAVLAFVALVGIAAVVVVGQAVARQSRREWADRPTLLAVGLSPRQLVGVAGIRGAAIGLAAVVVAAATCVALSPLGPIGIVRSTEVDPGVTADALVLLAGGALLVVVCSLAAGLAVARAPARAARLPRPRRARQSPVALPLSGTVGTGMAGQALRRGGSGLPLGAALLTLLFAVGTVAAAGSLQASVDHLLDSPEDYGVSWDLSVSGLNNDGDVEDELAALQALPEVDSTAGIVGTDIEAGDEVFWVHAIEPLSGPPDAIEPVVIDGRLPETVDEIALGSVVMDDLGVDLGDTVEAGSTVAGRQPAPLTVVGTAVVNDSFEDSPGRGGFVTLEWMERYAPEVTGDPYLVETKPGTDVDEFRRRLQEQTPGLVNGPVVQGAIRNVDRIRDLPFLLAAVLSVLALASFAHALVLSLRRQRRELAVLKSLGFDRRQSMASVSWFVTVLALPAALLGIPFGIALGRAIWRVVADQIGVGADTSSSWMWPLVAVLSAVVVANLVGLVPAWRLARLRSGEVLRTE